jgi:hypothetical protein
VPAARERNVVHFVRRAHQAVVGLRWRPHQPLLTALIAGTPPRIEAHNIPLAPALCLLSLAKGALCLTLARSPYVSQTSRHSTHVHPFMQATLERFLLLVVLAAAALLWADAAVSRSYSGACALWDARYRPDTQNLPQWTGGAYTDNCSTSSPGAMKVPHQGTV